MRPHWPAKSSPDMPSVRLHGRKDRLVGVGGSKLLHAQVPGSELHIAPGWGHCPQLDDPVGLSQLLVRTVDRWTAATSSPAADTGT